MPAPTIADRIRDRVALWDGTHQGAQMLLHQLGKRRDAATDDVEQSYWQERMDSVRRADKELPADAPALQVLALQDRWLAEINALRAAEAPSA